MDRELIDLWVRRARRTLSEGPMAGVLREEQHRLVMILLLDSINKKLDGLQNNE